MSRTLNPTLFMLATALLALSACATTPAQEPEPLTEEPPTYSITAEPAPEHEVPPQLGPEDLEASKELPAQLSPEEVAALLLAPDDVAFPPEDAERTVSGLATKVLQPGTGTVHPRASSTVTVHYTGWTTDGQMFDSSVQRGETISFPLNAVIAGWTEGVQLMVVGEKRRLWIPEELAYKGMAGRPKGMLVFDVELFEIQ